MMSELKNTATAKANTAAARDAENDKFTAIANEPADAELTKEALARNEPTLREIFEVPDKASDKGDDHWVAFQDKLKQEAKGIKWTAAMPDLGAKICELLDIKIHDVLMTAWKKAEALRQALAESKADPERSIFLDLAEHSIDYETKPFVDVKIKGASVKKITLTVALNFKLKGFTLKLQNGVIGEIQTGSCEAKGTIKYDRLAIAEKKLSPIKFPLTIKIPNLFPISEVPATELARSSKTLSKTEAPPAKPEAQKSTDEVERIEL